MSLQMRFTGKEKAQSFVFVTFSSATVARMGPPRRTSPGYRFWVSGLESVLFLPVVVLGLRSSWIYSLWEYRTHVERAMSEDFTCVLEELEHYWDFFFLKDTCFSFKGLEKALFLFILGAQLLLLFGHCFFKAGSLCLEMTCMIFNTRSSKWTHLQVWTSTLGDIQGHNSSKIKGSPYQKDILVIKKKTNKRNIV